MNESVIRFNRVTSHRTAVGAPDIHRRHFIASANRNHSRMPVRADFTLDQIAPPDRTIRACGFWRVMLATSDALGDYPSHHRIHFRSRHLARCRQN